MVKTKLEKSILLNKKRNAHYIFKYLLMINFLEYLEAGALPCLLLQLSDSFSMTSGQIGLLGGIVYISLSVGGPFAGYLLRNYDHQFIVGMSLVTNNVFTFLWALTPVHFLFSTEMFISIRFLMGFTQCVVCIYMPLWANEFAPKEQKTSWMSYQQASVPLGVMSGYILASLITSLSHESVFFSLLSWRWPFLIESFLLIPFCIGWFFIPKEHLNIRISHKKNETVLKVINSKESEEESGETTPLKHNNIIRNQYLSMDDHVMNKNDNNNDNDIDDYIISINNELSIDNNVTIKDTMLITDNETDLSPKLTDGYIEISKRKLGRQSIDTPSKFDLSPPSNPSNIGLSPNGVIKYDYNSFNNIEINDPHNLSNEFISVYDENIQSEPKNRNHHDATNKVRFKSPPRVSSPLLMDGLDGYVEMKSVIPSFDNTINYYHNDNKNNDINIERNSDSSDEDSITNYSEYNTSNTYNNSRPNRFHNYANGISNPILAERNNKRRLRRHSMTASLVDPLYSRDVIKISNEDLATLETADNIITMYPGLVWTNRANSIDSETSLQRINQNNNYSYSNFKIFSNMYANIYKFFSKTSNPVTSPSTINQLDTSNQQIDTKDSIIDKDNHNYRNRTYSSASDNDMNFYNNITLDRTESNLSQESLYLSSSSANTSTNNLINETVAKSSPLLPTDKAVRSLKKSSSKRSNKANGIIYTSLKDIARSQSNPPPVDKTLLNSLRKRLAVTRNKSNSHDIVTTQVIKTNNNDSNNTTVTSSDSQPSPDIGITSDNHENLTSFVQLNTVDSNATFDKSDSVDNSNIKLKQSTNISINKEVVDSYQNNVNIDIQQENDFQDFPLQTSIDISDDLLDGLEVDAIRTRTRSSSFSSSDSGSDDYYDYSNQTINSSTGNSTVNSPRKISVASGSFKSLICSIRKLLSMPVYSNLLGAMTCLYFTVTGVQYWGTAYLSVGLHAPLAVVQTLFILCTATGPTFGVFFGGWLIDVLGGYRGIRQRVVALELCCFFGVLGCLFTIPISLLSNIYAVTFFLWLVLFCGAAILPACSGMLVSIVPRRYRPLSSSISLVVFNLFGYSASLLLSGYLMQILEEASYECNQVCSLTWGFRLILMWCFIALSFLIKALLASYKSKDKKQAIVLRHSSIYTYVVGERDKRYNVYSSINI